VEKARAMAAISRRENAKLVMVVAPRGDWRADALRG
jgi:hypothetical protein